MIVVDTNVISEMMRRQPARAVWEWWSRQVPSSLYTTAISQAEVLYGILLLPSGKRRTAMQEAAHAVFAEDFEGRVLPFDVNAVDAYAKICADRRRAGRPIGHDDAQIAAIAACVGAALATRNVRDFERCGIDLIDPWAGP